MFTSDYNSRYLEAVKLAKALGHPVSEVPPPFALNELEDFIAKLDTERQEREAAKRPKGK